LWRKYVLARYGKGCVVHHNCGGKDNPIDAAHILPKGAYPQHRYDLMNGIPLCRTHHAYYEDNPEEFIRFLRKKFPLLSSWREILKRIQSEGTVPLYKLKEKKGILNEYIKLFNARNLRQERDSV
jgi:hypothetical protein